LAAAATTTAAATPAATPTATAAATAPAATAAPGHLLQTTRATELPIEQMERGETDVGHFLIVENEAVFGRVVVGLRDIGGG
jgi:hypothetical protein